ncbi:MAG: histidine phosphatase family protein [Kiritimatiellia bacterium]
MSTLPHSQAAARIQDTLMGVEGSISVSLVGSFWHGAEPARPSDVDVIVVGRKLDRQYFETCLAKAAALSPQDLGLAVDRVHINATFGPLKMDTADTAVLHLMIYDRAGHREHVLKSPFTCYDWEKSTRHAGQSLAAIYPVLRLQPRDFSAARRGVADYLADLRAGVITYRAYAFDGDTPRLRVAQHPLDARHQHEFAYHIIRNLVLNYLKLVRQANLALTTDEFVAEWEGRLPECREFIPAFLRLQKSKEQGFAEASGDAVETAVRFVEAFDRAVQRAWEDAPRLSFVRHAPTPLNDGSFLGQRRDPSIRPPASGSWEPQRPASVFASEQRRTQETAQLLTPGRPITIDRRLNEIDYGTAEGLVLTELAARHPDLVAAWQRGQDPRFPGGENQADVATRLHAFLQEISSQPDQTLVVTHNVVMRCLVGQQYDIPPRVWHKLAIPHLTSFDYRVRDGRIYPDISPTAKAAITDSLRPWTKQADD